MPKTQTKTIRNVSGLHSYFLVSIRERPLETALRRGQPRPRSRSDASTTAAFRTLSKNDAQRAESKGKAPSADLTKMRAVLSLLAVAAADVPSSGALFFSRQSPTADWGVSLFQRDLPTGTETELSRLGPVEAEVGLNAAARSGSEANGTFGRADTSLMNRGDAEADIPRYQVAAMAATMDTWRRVAAI